MPGSSDDPAAAASTSTRLVRRSGFAWLLAAVLVPVLITALVIGIKAGPTEDDLRQRSLAALDARGITGVQVDFSGRDATVVVPAGADATEARKVVAAVDGVRTAQTDGGVEPAGANPTSAPSTGTAEEPVGTPSAELSTPPAGADAAPFELSRTDDSITLSAVVRDQAAKEKLVGEVRALLAEGSEFVDQISVDEKTGVPNPTALTALLQALSTATGDASVKYDGAKVTLTGKVADQATKGTAARAAAAAVPGAVIANELQVPVIAKPPVSQACQTFEARLARLTMENRIVFLSGTAIVNEVSRPSVARAAVLLKSCATFDIEVGGHTDNLGSAATSLPLSQQRADAVKATLVQLGVAAGRITSRGYGETRPVAPNTTSAGRIANRRVEIRVLH
ncbi:channel-forming protein ArfA/OmpATb [Kribbella sp. CA-293567]|uniref:channel-forming protein ArfA/OmpATb n=1 Tax=Kribbella sp. CA-293567 TaxID=3002436 RepID=UPI0022DDD045|nr:OmpA family protein [Kribbella sp. CA-293567]WBQ07491.1 OmpA family protein [Kribbella sp. CA-293567]